MGQRKSTLYKDVKIGRGWQKVRAAFYSNGKVKPNLVIYKGRKEHAEGGYYANDRGKWTSAGKDALDAQRFRAELLHRDEIARLKDVPQPRIQAIFSQRPAKVRCSLIERLLRTIN
jgi:hypothetical protein